ncbi:MAG: DEAD/DEAH box helicase [Sedimentisphaerales bacterium]|nr:DEAD/DEAH box helicase [Sedimentisphaerales bacterium]
MPFKTFGLSDPLVRGILAAGYIAPTEIQSRVIPAVIEGKDIIGCAQTGTGKTAAFVLPILNRLSHERATTKKVIKSLIITPTRELAVQIEKAILGYGRFLDVSTLAVYGGVNIKGQLNALHRGVDIVVATPGRLMDHMNRRSVNLRHIEVLVLDEADRMLDMGFINDVRKIVGALPKKRQTLFFSATVSPEIKALAAGILKSPEMIQIGRPRNPIETITQHIYPVRKEQKMDLLMHMLGNSQMYSVLVFSRTKHGADKINRRLKAAGIVSVAIHSSRTQGQRFLAMDGFKRGKYQVMVATDIAARGIDVTGISHVINYDVPAYAEDYIHRIGRTGRAEAPGDAITFVSREEDKYIRKIEKFIGREFKPEKCKDFTYTKPDSPQPQLVDKGLSGLHRGKFPIAGKKTRASQRRRRKGPRR